MKNKHYFLFIGPERRKKSTNIGGCITAYEFLLETMRKNKNIYIKSINTNRPREYNNIRRMLINVIIIISVIKYIPGSDIIVLFSTNTSLYISVKILNYICRFYNKPLVVRKFGGISHKDHINTNKSTSKVDNILTELKKLSLYIPETEYAYNIAIKDGIKSLHIPNYRIIPQKKVLPNFISSCRYIYIGQVRKTKGIYEIIDSEKYIDKNIEIHIYGPLMDGITRDDFSKCRYVRYIGPLEPEEVLNTMIKYNTFVFPSYHEGEGHPGVIIEAFSLGLTVIASNWNFISELVDDSCGILIKPRDAKSLGNAINILSENSNLYKKLREGAIQRSKLYDINKWSMLLSSRLINIINEY